MIVKALTNVTNKTNNKAQSVDLVISRKLGMILKKEKLNAKKSMIENTLFFVKYNETAKSNVIISIMMYYTLRMKTAGLPAHISFDGIDFVTTEPAPTIEFSPTVTPLRIIECPHIHAPLHNLISIALHSKSI